MSPSRCLTKLKLFTSVDFVAKSVRIRFPPPALPISSTNTPQQLIIQTAAGQFTHLLSCRQAHLCCPCGASVLPLGCPLCCPQCCPCIVLCCPCVAPASPLYCPLCPCVALVSPLNEPCVAPVLTSVALGLPPVPPLYQPCVARCVARCVALVLPLSSPVCPLWCPYVEQVSSLHPLALQRKHQLQLKI